LEDEGGGGGGWRGSEPLKAMVFASPGMSGVERNTKMEREKLYVPKKTKSTLCPVLALVSKKEAPTDLANSAPAAVVTNLCSSRSHLFPEMKEKTLNFYRHLLRLGE